MLAKSGCVTLEKGGVTHVGCGLATHERGGGLGVLILCCGLNPLKGEKLSSLRSLLCVC